MMLSVGIKKSTDHPLVLCVVFARFVLEKVNAALAQRNGHLNAFVAEHEIFWARQKVWDDPEVSEGFIRVLDSLAHKFAFLCANNRLQGCGLRPPDT